MNGSLSHMEDVVTSDAIILDQCKGWYNLNRPLMESAIPNAWILRLDGLQSSIIVPHPPIIIPTVGRGQEREVQATIDAYEPKRSS